MLTLHLTPDVVLLRLIRPEIVRVKFVGERKTGALIFQNAVRSQAYQ